MTRPQNTLKRFPRLRTLLIRLVSSLQYSVANATVLAKRGARKRLAIVVQYDPRNRFDSTFLRYLDFLKQTLVYDVLVVANVDSNGESSPTRATALAPYAEILLERPNKGHDFAAWRDAIRWLKDGLGVYESVLLTNDSIYGPLQGDGVRRILSGLEKIEVSAGPAILGISENEEVTRHLQSYFLAFNRAAVSSDFWRSFWSEVRNLRDKHQIIIEYEVGLSAGAKRAGISIEAVYPAVSGRGNPTLRGQRPEGFPFLKRELVLEHPEVLEELETADQSFAGAIRAHAEAFRKGRGRAKP